MITSPKLKILIFLNPIKIRNDTCNVPCKLRQ
jgi:hypothetical protein